MPYPYLERFISSRINARAAPGDGRMFPKLFAVFTALLLIAPAGAEPNILVLIADDMGWHDRLSRLRYPHTASRSTGQGWRAPGEALCYPTCSPTRAGLLSGRNPSRFNILGPIDRRSSRRCHHHSHIGSKFSRNAATPPLCSASGTSVSPEVGPCQYGFAQSYGYLHGQIDPYTHRYKNGDPTWHRNDVFVEEKGHATDLIARETIHFLGTRRKGPFFAWVAFSVPHHPLQEEDKWTEPYRKTIKDPSRRLYAASITHMDAMIGVIIDTLEKSGQLGNTVILFTSDNGGQRDYSSTTEYEGKHGPFPVLGDNRPLRGWKGELYEGGIRVPAFVYWRDRLKPRAVEQTVSYLDWLPTFAHRAGAKLDPAWKLEGRDIWSLLTGEKTDPPPALLYWHIGRASDRDGR